MAQRKKPAVSLQTVPAMPLHVEVVGGQPLVVLQGDAEGDRFVFSDPGLPSPQSPRLMDADGIRSAYLSGPNVRLLRDEFLSVRTSAEAFSFLKASYAFLWPVQLQQEHGWTHNLTWNAFQDWQEFIGEIGVRGFPFRFGDSALHWERPFIGAPVSEKFSILFDTSPPFTQNWWLRGKPSGISFERQLRNGEEKPVMRVEVHTAVEALLASLYFNELAGMRSQKCGLKECKRIFDLTSGHAREYCTPQHAHLAGVRRRRANLPNKKETHGKA